MGELAAAGIAGVGPRGGVDLEVEIVVVVGAGVDGLVVVIARGVRRRREAAAHQGERRDGCR